MRDNAARSRVSAVVLGHCTRIRGRRSGSLKYNPDIPYVISRYGLTPYVAIPLLIEASNQAAGSETLRFLRVLILREVFAKGYVSGEIAPDVGVFLCFRCAS